MVVTRARAIQDPTGLVQVSGPRYSARRPGPQHLRESDLLRPRRSRALVVQATGSPVTTNDASFPLPWGNGTALILITTVTGPLCF